MVIYKLKGSDTQHSPADYTTQKEEAQAVLKAFEDLFLALASTLRPAWIPRQNRRNPVTQTEMETRWEVIAPNVASG